MIKSYLRGDYVTTGNIEKKESKSIVKASTPKASVASVAKRPAHAPRRAPSKENPRSSQQYKGVSPVINKSQRVGVFVDVANLYHSARQLYHAKVNYKALLQHAINGRQVIRAFAYVITSDVKGEQGFFDALGGIGYEVRAKDLQIFPGGAKKGDWDVGIAMDMIELADKLDVAVLVSGDGDYVPLVHHLRSRGCKIEVISLKGSTSSKLVDVADEFIDLEKNKRKFFLK